MLIKYFLESKKCNWLWNGSILKTPHKDDNKFEYDYVPFLDSGVDGMHPGPIHNNIYAKKLYDYAENKNLI